MTKQVALADMTYERLRKRRRKGESFSDVIERLLTEGPKDPLSFVMRVPRSRTPAKERLAQIEADRDSTQVDA
jgi:predicted CopG family antitoxin